MPIYEYACMSCESRFEELVRNGTNPDCPDCGSANVRRQLSTFARPASDDDTRVGRPSGSCCGGNCGCA